MQYLSTRGHPDRKRFCEILLEGLAPDGGLYLPESYPQINATALQRLRPKTPQRQHTGLGPAQTRQVLADHLGPELYTVRVGWHGLTPCLAATNEIVPPFRVSKYLPLRGGRGRGEGVVGQQSSFLE